MILNFTFIFTLSLYSRSNVPMNNAELATRISTFLNAQTSILTKKEFSKAMGKIYTDLEKGKTAKKEGVEKKKREPNEYNLFVRSEMAVLKQRVQDGETSLTNREMMTRIGKLWQEKKSANGPEVKKEVKKPAKKQADKEEKKPAKKQADKEEKKTAKKQPVKKEPVKKEPVKEKSESESEEEDEEDSDDE